MPITDRTTTQTVVSNWPYDFQRIDGENYLSSSPKFGTLFGAPFAGTGSGTGASDPLWNFLTAFAKELNDFDRTQNRLYSQKFLETATGVELEKIAREVGITRRAGETDSKLRFRARVRRAAASSNATAEDIRALLQITFGKESLSKITVSQSTAEPVTRFEIPKTLFDTIPITKTELEDELRRAYPAGYDVNITTPGTFNLGASGGSGIGNGTLT